MNDQPMMTCDWCEKEFPATPEACVDGGFSGFHPTEAGEEWKGHQQWQGMTQEQIETMDPEDRQSMKGEMGLTDAQLDELLLTGKVTGLGAIVCIECQAAGLED